MNFLSISSSFSFGVITIADSEGLEMFPSVVKSRDMSDCGTRYTSSWGLIPTLLAQSLGRDTPNVEPPVSWTFLLSPRCNFRTVESGCPSSSFLIYRFCCQHTSVSLDKLNLYILYVSDDSLYSILQRF